MAVRPTITPLEKGKAIGAQQNFCDMFNWVVACLNNIRGAGDVKIRWVSSDTPEIYLDSNQHGGEGSGGMLYNIYQFDILPNNKLREGCIQVGGYSYPIQSLSYTAPSNGIVCLKFDLIAHTAATQNFNSFAALQSAQQNLQYYIIPLYKFVDGVVAVDYRPMPNAGAWEDPRT